MDNTSKTPFLRTKSAKLTMKLLFIFILTLFLLIPQSMIMDLVNERQNLSDGVVNEISQGWGTNQIIAGPDLVIPYTETVESANPKILPIKERRNLLVHPTTLKINGTLDTFSKYRNIYNVLLYKSQLNISGTFTIPDYNQSNIKPDQFLLNQAYLTILVSDLKGISKQVNLKWNDTSLPLKPGTRNVTLTSTTPIYQDYESVNYNPNNQGIKTGLNTNVSLDNAIEPYKFSMDLDLKGSRTIQFVPLAQNNEIDLKSPFPNPNFIGGFLPEHTITTTGFEAKWNILEYNKSTPAFQVNQLQVAAENNLFGIKILPILDNYRTTYRAGRYMILFVVLTFLVVFLTEIVNNINIHIFQYTLIGLALAIFFTLLLSISEFLGFDLAYLISTTATILLIFAYSTSLFRNRKSSFVLLLLMLVLFGYIYLIIQLENTALLAGSIGLFVIIAGTMYTSKQVKWFEEVHTDLNENIENQV